MLSDKHACLVNFVSPALQEEQRWFPLFLRQHLFYSLEKHPNSGHYCLVSRRVTFFLPPTTALGWPYCRSPFLLVFFSCKDLSKPMWSQPPFLQLHLEEWAPVRLQLIQTQQWGKRDPGFAVTLLVLQIPFRAASPPASAHSLASSGAAVESGVIPMLLGLGRLMP